MNNEYTARSLRWFEEVWNQRRTETIDEFLTADSIAETEDGVLRGPDEFKKQVHAPMLDAFPDLHVDVEGTVTEDDSVVIRWKATGTHQGDGLGIKATGRPIVIRGITWHRFRDDKLVGGGDYWSQESLKRQLQDTPQ